MALLYTFEGWPSAPSVNNAIRTYNLDTGTWSATGITTAPFSGQVVSSSALRQKGGYDPVASKWYVISPTGTLYAYAVGSNTWSGALVSGSILMYNTAEDHHWDMAHDGRFLYILKAENATAGIELFRYDAAADELDTLPGPPSHSSITVSNQGKYFLVYDGDDRLYSYSSNDQAAIEEYTISTGKYRNLPIQTTMASDNMGNFCFAFFVNHKLIVIYALSNIVGKVFSYDPSANTWTQKTSTAFVFNVNNLTPYHIDSSTSVRIWNANNANESYIYNFITDTWSNAGSNNVFTPQQGCNWAQTRVVSGEYIWYEADGATQLGNRGHRADIGTGTIDLTFSYHVQVKTVNARPSGITVSVPTMLDWDGDDVVTIANTENGSYSSSFVTAALSAGDFVDVWIRALPSITQSLGTQKLFNLRVVSNS